MDKLEAFYVLAKAYLEYIMNTEISGDSAASLVERLMKLYIAAQNLPEPEPETERAVRQGEAMKIRLGEKDSPYYWMELRISPSLGRPCGGCDPIFAFDQERIGDVVCFMRSSNA
jgi:hypothetical protein